MSGLSASPGTVLRYVYNPKTGDESLCINGVEIFQVDRYGRVVIPDIAQALDGLAGDPSIEIEQVCL